MLKSKKSVLYLVCLFLVPLFAHALTVSPSTATLYATATQTFTCSGVGCSGATWSVVSGPGSINSSGVYTAPSTLSAPTTATVRATGSGGILHSDATVTLDVAVTPVEVYGTAAGGTSSASVTQNIYLPNAPSGTVKLHMQVHNIRWDGMASVKVNNSSTTIIDNTNCPPDTSVSVMATFSPFGGITGGFDTITCNMTFSSGIVTQGANTIIFYFNGTTGTNCTNYTNYPNNFCNESAGYRVVSFQLVDSGSNNLIPAAEIYYVDPSTFTASTTQSDITAGYQLFTNTGAAGTPIKGYVNGSYVTLNANCSTCHVADLKNRSGSTHQDGYDLTYFNYSPSVIQARSMFHNLSSTQGAQIAAYILSLRNSPTSVPNPGLPWNPPYQPGSGLDSNPIINWAAGAGVSAVQVDDAHFGSNCVSGMSSWTYST